MDHSSQQQLQREYYARTAGAYDEMHIAELDEHQFALAWLSGLIEPLGIRSVLDVGSGTGRALRTLKKAHPHLRVVGIEPSAELREIGHRSGLDRSELVEGDGTALAFADGEFDLVCEFGMLHHVPRPELVVAEMLRIGRDAVLISDSNNFGQGSPRGRLLKQVLNRLGLWRACDRIRTKGKGYHWNEGDGLYYSYSVFNNYPQIKAACRSVHVLNTRGNGSDPYRTAPAVALLGLKATDKVESLA